MYAFSSASCKVVGFVSAAFGLGVSCGFGVEPFGRVGFGLAVSAGFASAGFGVEPFGKVGFGLAVSAGFAVSVDFSNPFGNVPFGLVVAAGVSAGFGVEPFGKVGFGLAVSAGFASAGFGASVVVAEGGFNCSDNLDSFASSAAIFSSRSCFVLVLRFVAIQITNNCIVYVHFV
jgi:hypothetical protein